MAAQLIKIRGARQHNLKGFDLDLPRERLIVVTGLSGSGKSTLAFDTLYAEGQRRYVESLSAYARQFLERLEKPAVERVEGLSPAIAIEQKAAGHNPRSTVGTITEIADYLRLLYARIGVPHCPQCGATVTSQTLDEFIETVMGLPEGARLMVFAPVVRQQTGSHHDMLKRLQREGFARVRIDGAHLHALEEPLRLAANHPHTIEVVVDRLVLRPATRNRLADSLELALALAAGRASVEALEGPQLAFCEEARCAQCDIRLPALTPASFSFNTPQGACAGCDGLGFVEDFDPDLLVPDQRLSLREGAILPWAHRHSVHFLAYLESLTAHYGTDVFTPYAELPQELAQVLMYGSGKEKIPFRVEGSQRRAIQRRPFEGLVPRLRRQWAETKDHRAQDEIRRYLRAQPCRECGGTRLNPTARRVEVGDTTLPALCSLSIAEAHDHLRRLTLAGQRRQIADKLITEIDNRFSFLMDVGLSYLTLDRSAQTLSGGENQRIRLATQIGSKLTGVLYVLDEPSIGLHPRDHQRLLQSLRQMRDLGNTVLVVEHDRDTILTADHVVDMGPAAGINGGQVVFSGPPHALLKAPQSLTGDYLSGRRAIPLPRKRRTPSEQQLILEDVAQNNLQHITVHFPLGQLICVTGVSGSGKSSLVLETLYPALTQQLYRSNAPVGKHARLKGVSFIDKVIHIDQSPIGKTPRSNPGTYTGLFALIRDLFARTPESRARGYKSGRFSFNVKGGRCEACRGDGLIKIEMHFLPDLHVTCDACQGRRYNRETLEVKYKGHNIVEVLDMTVNQASAFFERMPNFRAKLDTLIDVGLGYLRIGQPATTLSGGESQRIKLARELSRKATGNTVYILDEPTTGLHFQDVHHLLGILQRLVDAGNTVIVIEHNLDVVKCADHIIDLGPEGGAGGGRIVASGTPEALARNPASHTGHFLREVLCRSRPMDG